MPRKIRIVTVRVGRPPQVEEVEDSLAAFQEVVGGYVEVHNLGGNFALVCNEDGMSMNLPQNGCGILGPYLFTRVDADGDNVSLSAEDTEKCMAYAAAYRQVKHRGGHMEVLGFASLAEMQEFLDRQRREANEAN
jgi:hypothetical protein